MAEVRNWLVVSQDDNTILNIIAATEDYAAHWNLPTMYEGAVIGGRYDPPKEDYTTEALTLLILADQESRICALELGV